MKALITGGVRSGKSARALQLAAGLGPARCFVATAQALDAEMKERIARHRHERDASWTTVEAPLDLAGAISTASGDVVLVDCLTLWLSNLMMAECDDETIAERISELCAAVETSPRHCVMVTNEVGFGVVPATPMGRRFRDHTGRAAQAVAAACDRVELVVAGLPLVLKGAGHPSA